VETLSAAAKGLVPGSLLFLLFGLFIGVFLLFMAPRWGRRWLTTLLILYVLLSLQGTSDLLIRGLAAGYRPLRTPAEARGARIVVVLGNGSAWIALPDGQLGVLNAQSSYNAIETARVYRLLGNPLVLASGGQNESVTLKSALTELGVPKTRIVQETTSTTTRQQGENVVDWLRQHGETRFVLVTTPEHIRRAAGVFGALGLDPIPSVSSIAYGGPPFWKPTGYALQGSRNAIYEYGAWVFYRARGWL
jgi:uncharacterized SAM-binding protein YcdF (DUF218 family)